MTDVSVVPPASMPIERRVDGSDQLTHIIERYLRDPSVDITKLEQMITLQERMLHWQAEREWNTAMAEAQSRMKAIAKDSGNLSTKSRYASYAAMDAALRPIYTELGFALSFNTEESRENMIKIVCDVSKGGHSRRYQIDMPADGKGARGNEVMTRTHATGSAVSYGMRYLLTMIFNAATTDDDDGVAAGHRGNRPPPAPAPNAMRGPPDFVLRRPPPPPPPGPEFDPVTGEIISPSAQPPAAAATPAPPPDDADGGAGLDDDEASDRILQLDNRLEEEAEKGIKALQAYWLTLSTADRRSLKGALDNRHKPRAEAVERGK